MRLLLVLALGVSLTGCSLKEEGTDDITLNSEIVPPPTPADAAAPEVARLLDAGTATAAVGAAPTPAPPVAMVAYEYKYLLGAPQGQVRGLIARHEARCRMAGPANCQVINSDIREQGDASLYGWLELRGSPAWVAAFRSGLAEDTAKSDGRIINSGVESEDLSRSIIDTTARLRAMTTLRDRLQTLLDTRPGKLADLIEIERELARVQGEIDSAQSQLIHDRGRVTTSKLTLKYEARNALGRDSLWSPLAEAFGDFIGLMIGVVAFLIRSIAVLIPLAAIGWLLTFVFRKPLARWRETRRQKKSQKLALRKANRALTRRRPPV